MMIEIPARDERVYPLDTEHAALLIIDMQRDFLAPGGYADTSGFDISYARRIIPAVQRLLAAARRAGFTIVHTREGYLPDLSDLTSAKAFRSRAAGAEIGAAGPMGRLLVRGEYGHDFLDELRPVTGEVVIDKPGFGAFYETPLQDVLAAKGVTHLLITGVTTQCCVHSTLREAVDRGYWCTLVQDCTAAFDKKTTSDAIDIVETEGGLFGWVTTSEEIIAAMRPVFPVFR